MRIRLAIPDELDDKDREQALNAALEAVTVADTALVRRGKVPTAKHAIKQMGIRWKPEPPGDEHFDLATTVVGRKWGDCDDLAPYYAGSLRASGTDPNARAFVRRSGPNRWHALVRRGNGSIEDPSIHAGMGANVSGPGNDPPAAIHQPMSADPRLCIAVVGDARQWFARVDVPDGSEDWSWTSLAANANPRAALQHAVKSARLVVGDDLEEEDDYRLRVISDLISGHDPYEIAEALAELAGDDVDIMRVMLDGVNSVGFLDSITKPFKAAARFVAPITRPLARAYDKVSPYSTMLFPGMAQIADTARAAATGDPMAVYKSRLMPGTQSGRDFFERNPLGRPAFTALSPFLKNVPGGEKWLAAAAPRPAGAPGAPRQGAPQAMPQRPPPTVQQLISLLLGQDGNAPPTRGAERGAAVQPFPTGPAFVRF